MQISRTLLNRVAAVLASQMNANFTDPGCVLLPIDEEFAESPNLAIGDLSFFESSVNGAISFATAAARFERDTGNPMIVMLPSDGQEPFVRTADTASTTVYGWAVTIDANSDLLAWSKLDVPETSEKTGTVWYYPPLSLTFPAEMFR